ncbi:indolethylamine N-methyltransferase-like [Ascaphus truei]|uniref:indolethylamine N-methyltransferase-like n=1 Tax=Ascaphus truei TaxID=8439 RepID=UPI003F592C7A
MASTPHKDYHDEEFDAKNLMETYVGADKTDSKEELLHYPLCELFKILSPGCVRGDTLIDLSIGTSISQLLIASDYFKEIIMLESSDVSIREIEKWLKKEPGAVDRSHAAMFVCELEGKSEGWEEKEEKVRRAITRVVKCDFTKANPLDPVVVPQADGLISVWYLEAASKDHDSYLSNLKKMSSFLKVGGHLILFVFLNVSYYMIDQHKFSMLTYDEEFAKKALRDTGFNIKSFGKYKNKLSTQIIDYEHVGYFVACKEREV